MLRFNKKIEYGVIALLHLDSCEDRAASVREIAQQRNIPETLLSKIMQTLNKAGCVVAVHGNQGGYRLEKGLGDISLLDLTTMLTGPVQLTECLEPGNDSCPAKSACTIVSPMSVLNQKIINLFQSTSLEALASRKVAL